MSIFNKLKNIGTTMVSAVSSRPIDSFCLLETGSGNNLFGHDGSIATVVRVIGANTIGSDEDLRGFSEFVSDVFTPFMLPTGHAVQFFMKRDPDRASDIVGELLETQRRIANVLQMDLEGIFKEKQRHLRKYIADEAAYLVLWTRPSVLSGPDLKKLNAEMREEKPDWWPKAVDAQYLDVVSKTLISRHGAFVSTVVSKLKTGNDTFLVDLEVIGAHTAAQVIRGEMYPGLGHKGFRVLLPEDVKSGMPWPRAPMKRNDASHLLFPRLSHQIFDEPAIEDDGPGIVIRGRRYANVDVSIGPIKPTSFNRLIDTIRGMGDEMPWRVSFLMEGNGLAGYDVLIKSGLAKLTAPFKLGAANSALYNAAVEALESYRTEHSVAVPRIRISFATWAPAADIDLINQRVNKLQRAVENWGTMHTTTVTGDRLEGIMSSVPAVDIRSTATAGLAPLNEALYVMPWMRESSPFKNGSLFLRTRDGRPFMIEMASSIQDNWFDIIYGGSGKGKSVLLNSMATSFVLSSNAVKTGRPQVPFSGTIDIGVSVEGPIRLIQDSLPPELKHLAIFHRMRMLRDDGINLFDLPLGLDAPLPVHKSMLVNVISIMASSASIDGMSIQTPVGMIELVSLLIGLAYEIKGRGRNGSPNTYVRGENALIDNELDKLNVAQPATWLDVRDIFFDREMYREAKIAQRYAVPQLQDLMITHLPQVESKYSDPDGANLVRSFERMIQQAQNDYPILDGPTQIDFSSARMIGLDISQIAPKANVKQTSIMYLMAIYLLTSNFTLHKDDVDFFPEKFRAYHAQEISNMSQMTKRIVCDEFHRTQGVRQVRSQIVTLGREGRKYGIQIALGSQQIEDFDDEMVRLASNVWICGVGSSEVNTAKALFKLSPSATHALRRVLTGPTPDGAPVLGIFKMKDGQHEHILVNTLGPEEIWAYSTSQQDVALRTRVYEAVGPAEGRRRLGIYYPGGSAMIEIIKRANAAIMNSEISSDDAQFGAIGEIAAEIIAGNHSITAAKDID